MPSNVGSLELTGQWYLQTNSTSLVTNATAYTISGFIKYNDVPNTYSAILSATYDVPIEIYNSTAAQYQIYGAGGTYNVTGYFHTFTLGVVYHIAITWAASGNWYVYVNGIQVATGASGPTPWTSDQLFSVGYNAAAAPDIQLANWAIWANYQATGDDVINLCNSIYTPATLVGSVSGAPQPATTWWTLADAPSGSPRGPDNSFADQLDSNPLVNFGGNILAAAYAPPLVWVPPATPSAYITKNGLIAIFFTATNLSSFTNVTAITTAPSFYKNGSGTAMANVQGPFWMNSQQDCPFLLYQPPTPFVAGDTLTMSTAAGWATSALGAVGRVTALVVPNYVGKLEPSVGSYNNLAVPGFNQPSSEWTMKVGYVMPWGMQAIYYASAFAFANALKRSFYPGGITTNDANGHPITISAPLALQPVQSNQGGALDGRGIPTLTGTYTFVADESNPGSPMTGVWSDLRGNVTVSKTTVVGAGVAKSWSATFTYPSNPTTFIFNPTFTISGTGSGGSGNWTLTDECFLMPNNPTRPANPWAIDQNVANWLTTPSGKTPYWLRWYDSVLSADDSNAVAPSDLMNPANFVWGSTPNEHTFNVTSVNAFNTTDSPYLYWEIAYPNATQPGGGPPGAPYATPTSAGFLNFSGPASNWFMAKFTYDNSSVQLKSGQTIIFPNGVSAVPCSNGDQANTTVTIDGNQVCLVWMTSPTTFVTTFYNDNATFTNTNGQPGGINNVVGTNAVTATATLQLPDLASVGHAPSAYATSQLAGSNYWANFPPLATDATWTTIIGDILTNFPAGRKIICELGDEAWNNIYNNWWLSLVLANTAAYGSSYNDLHKTYAIKQAHLNQLCLNAATALGRGSDIVCGFGSQFEGPGITQEIVNTINVWNGANPTNQFRIDCVWVAQYEHVPGTDSTNAGQTDTTMVNACASIYAANSNSIEFGNAYPWTRGQWWDASRHYLKYNTAENGPSGYMAGQIAALKTYVPIAGQPPGFVPQLITYEGGLELAVPYGISSNSAMRQQLAHDLYYDPGMADWEIALYQSWQYGGISEATIYALCMQRGDVLWTNYIWDGQQPGDGSTNTFFSDTGKAEDFTNKSVRGYAWRKWADAANGASPTPTSTANAAALVMGS